MQTFVHGRDLIGDLDFSKEEVETVLDVAFDLERKRALGEPARLLRDKVLAMLFFFSSTRTRGSFKAGMAELGGHGAFMDPYYADLPRRRAEGDRRDLRPLLRRHRHPPRRLGLGERVFKRRGPSSRVPVLNMQCDIYHPFQCLADLMTIVEKKDTICAIERWSCRGPMRPGTRSPCQSPSRWCCRCPASAWTSSWRIRRSSS